MKYFMFAAMVLVVGTLSCKTKEKGNIDASDVKSENTPGAVLLSGKLAEDLYYVGNTSGMWPNHGNPDFYCDEDMVGGSGFKCRGQVQSNRPGEIVLAAKASMIVRTHLVLQNGGQFQTPNKYPLVQGLKIAESNGGLTYSLTDESAGLAISCTSGGTGTASPLCKISLKWTPLSRH